MSYIQLDHTEKTPKVLMDTDKKIFEIEGNSRPENVREFYFPIVQKLVGYFDDVIAQNNIDDYNETPFKFNFRLGYFNSSTAKFISDILIAVGSNSEKGLDLRVYWYFDQGDDDMREAGEDFSEMIDLPFNFIMVSK